jgi:hypothetical protein
VALTAFGGGAADRVGVFVGAGAREVDGAGVGVCAAACVAGPVDGVDAAAELGGALDAIFADAAGESTTGGSLALSGETNGGRAARVGADLNPSKRTTPVMVPSVARTGRFIALTRASQLERLSMDASR